MTLEQFMERVGARPADVARATGLHPSIIIRVKRGDSVPSGTTMAKLDSWAGKVALALGLPESQRLSWHHLAVSRDSNIDPRKGAA